MLPQLSPRARGHGYAGRANGSLGMQRLRQRVVLVSGWGIDDGGAAVAFAGGNERRGKVVAARFDKFLKDATSVWATKRRRQWHLSVAQQANFVLGVVNALFESAARPSRRPISIFASAPRGSEHHEYVRRNRSGRI